MQKLGMVTLVYDDGIVESYNIAYYDSMGSYERLDIYENDANYNIINTSECVASYIKDKNELLLGDINLIKKVFRIKKNPSLVGIQEVQNVKVEDGSVVFTSEKNDEKAGNRYYSEMLDGALVRQEYQSIEGEIIFDSIDNSDVSSFRVINISEYNPINSLVDVRVTTSKTAEYYSYNELLRKFPEVIHVLDNDYEVVESEEQFWQRLNMWINYDCELKSVDVETSGLKMTHFGDDYITGVILGCDETHATYFPFAQEKFEYNLPHEYLNIILDAIENQPNWVKILAHNGKFEIESFLKETGRIMRLDVDTFILSVLVSPRMRKGAHDLKSLTNKYEGKFYLSLHDIFIGPVRFNVLTKDIVKIYACPDGTSPAKIYKHLMKELPKDEWRLAEDTEYPLVKVEAENEYYGLPVDMETLRKNYENAEYSMNLLGNEFKRIHNTSANINSPEVLRDILYNKLRCEVELRTTTGQPSTSVFAVDRLVDLGKLEKPTTENYPPDIKDKFGKVLVKGKSLAHNRYPSLLILQAYNLVKREYTSYKRMMNKSNKGRVEFYINQVGAESGRRTSDAHQYSDGMKECVVADSKHHHLISCDYKQVELRVLPFLAGQKDLIEMESDPEIDVHRAILSIINKIPMWSISDEMRKEGKSTNFGVVYMMSEYGLAKKNAGSIKYTKKDVQKARESILAFFNGLPYIKDFKLDNEKQVRENGFIRTLDGRYRYFQEILDPTTDPKKVQSMVRAANNTPVQGFAAWLLKTAENRYYNYIRDKGWDKLVNCDGEMLPMVRLMLSIHDEVLVSAHESIPIEELLIMFKECMEIEVEGAPPFFAAPAFVNNWLDGKQDAYEIPIPFRDIVIEKYRKGVTGLLTYDNYLDDLNKYRTSVLRDYMEGLINKYQTPEEIAKNVVDDNLTHVLISAYCKGDIKKELSHSERIRYAVDKYIEERGKNIEVMSFDVPNEYKEIYSEVEEGINLSEYLKFSPDGSVEVDDTLVSDDMLEDDFNSISYEPTEEDYVAKSYCFYMRNTCLIDVSTATLEQAKQLATELTTLFSEREYYTVSYLRNGRMLETTNKIAYKEDEINDICRKIFEGEHCNA